MVNGDLKVFLKVFNAPKPLTDRLKISVKGLRFGVFNLIQYNFT